MSTKHLRNISIAKFEAFLELVGCEMIRHPSGHFVYSRSDCLRPIIFQDHINPVPEFIIKNNLRILGYTKKEFYEILDFEKEVIRVGNNFAIKQKLK